MQVIDVTVGCSGARIGAMLLFREKQRISYTLWILPENNGR